MALNIKDPATEKSVRELVAATGETVTPAVRRAAEERLDRVRRNRKAGSLADDLLEIGRRCPRCRSWTAVVPKTSSATTNEACRPDRHRHLSVALHLAE